MRPDFSPLIVALREPVSAKDVTRFDDLLWEGFAECWKGNVRLTPKGVHALERLRARRPEHYAALVAEEASRVG